MFSNKRRSDTAAEEVKGMHCPHLVHLDSSCDVVEPRYYPSDFEADEYCATEQHLRCPLYHNYLLNAASQFIKARTASEARLTRVE